MSGPSFSRGAFAETRVYSTAISASVGEAPEERAPARGLCEDDEPMDHVAFDREPPAGLTTLVMAFGGWIDAGRAATGALRHLVRDLGAERVARIEAEEFFVFTQERPTVRMRDDGHRDIHWPLSEFFAAPPAPGREGLLLFSGPEPHQRWQTYTKAFLDLAERCGVRQIVSL